MWGGGKDERRCSSLITRLALPTYLDESARDIVDDDVCTRLDRNRVTLWRKGHSTVLEEVENPGLRFVVCERLQNLRNRWDAAPVLRFLHRHVVFALLRDLRGGGRLLVATRRDRRDARREVEDALRRTDVLRRELVVESLAERSGSEPAVRLRWSSGSRSRASSGCWASSGGRCGGKARSGSRARSRSRAGWSRSRAAVGVSDAHY